jgi:hypothetical protein
VILFLTVTGYGLYYAGDEQLRSLISRWHTWIGLGVFLLIPVHVLIGRALRRKRSRGSAGIAGSAASAEAPTTQSRTIIGEK